MRQLSWSGEQGLPIFTTSQTDFAPFTANNSNYNLLQLINGLRCFWCKLTGITVDFLRKDFYDFSLQNTTTFSGVSSDEDHY